MSAAGIKHRGAPLVGLRFVRRREPVPGGTWAPGADEGGNAMPPTGPPDERAVVGCGAGISRRHKALGAETGVSPGHVR
jgi:hypothetical protein